MIKISSSSPPSWSASWWFHPPSRSRFYVGAQVETTDEIDGDIGFSCAMASNSKWTTTFLGTSRKDWWATHLPLLSMSSPFFSFAYHLSPLSPVECTRPNCLQLLESFCSSSSIPAELYFEFFHWAILNGSFDHFKHLPLLTLSINYYPNGYMLKTRSKSPLIFPNIENTDINGNCLTKDQEVTLLKRKLVETHNKLIA